MKVFTALTVPATVLGLAALAVVPAGAHPPVVSADCHGPEVEVTAWTTRVEVGHGCGTTPPQPPAQQVETSSTQLDCDDELQTTETVVTTTPYVLDEQTGTWVPGQPFSETTTTETPVPPGSCPVEAPGAPASAQTPPQPPPSHRAPMAVAVPTAVSAGGLPGGSPK